MGTRVSLEVQRQSVQVCRGHALNLALVLELKIDQEIIHPK